jgi:hypothetical protein
MKSEKKKQQTEPPAKKARLDVAVAVNQDLKREEKSSKG